VREFAKIIITKRRLLSERAIWRVAFGKCRGFAELERQLTQTKA